MKELEEKLAAYVGRKHCITCANGTDALQIAYMAYGIGEGDAVFCPDITFVSSCSNGSNSYIPSQEAFDYGCYESYVATVAPGTGEELVSEYLRMLEELKNS